MKNVKLFQKDIDKVATDKLEYDKIISHYNTAINNTENNNIIMQRNNNSEGNISLTNEQKSKDGIDLVKKREIDQYLGKIKVF